MSNQQLPGAYYDGKSERRRNQAKDTVPHKPMTRLWAWWLAGWNDCDIELTRLPR
jgi:hypothetical protein